MVLNISKDTFCGAVRNGDIIALANVVEFLRKTYNDSTLRFYMKPDAINSANYIQDFFAFILKNTDYFSIYPGNTDLAWNRVNPWDFRDISGDLVKIKNTRQQEKKVVVFPVFDAPYNVYRNWTPDAFNSILSKFSTEEYEGHEKIVCVAPNIVKFDDLKHWKVSNDFMTNINHIMTAEVFVGGDTGTSHFAWALDKGPKELIYCNSSRGLLHCLPFYLLEGKGKVMKYWLNMEGTTF